MEKLLQPALSLPGQFGLASALALHLGCVKILQADALTSIPDRVAIDDASVSAARVALYATLTSRSGSTSLKIFRIEHCSVERLGQLGVGTRTRHIEECSEVVRQVRGLLGPVACAERKVGIPSRTRIKHDFWIALRSATKACAV